MIELAPIAIPPELEALPDVVGAIIPDIAEAVRTYIVAQAHERLHSSSQDYVQGVQPVEYHYPSGRIPINREVVAATILLVGQLPNMIELGWVGGDMKPALLRGRNVKFTKDGKPYNTVPFRHGNPKATGRNFPAMGSQFAEMLGAERARRLGQTIYAKARNLKQGERLAEGLAPRLRRHHVTDIYAGMQRQQGAARSVQYKTFRTVSLGSDPESWIHPGIEPHHIFRDAARYAQEISPKLLLEAIRGR